MTPIPPNEIEQKRMALFEELQRVKRDQEEIFQRIDGLGHTPKDQRQAKFEMLKAELMAKQQEEDEIRKQLQALALPPPQA